MARAWGQGHKSSSLCGELPELLPAAVGTPGWLWGQQDRAGEDDGADGVWSTLAQQEVSLPWLGWYWIIFEASSKMQTTFIF